MGLEACQVTDENTNEEIFPPELSEAINNQADAMRVQAEAQRKSHEIDYRHRSLDMAIASFHPQAAVTEDKRILERAERFWLYLVTQ